MHNYAEALKSRWLVVPSGSTFSKIHLKIYYPSTQHRPLTKPRMLITNELMSLFSTAPEHHRLLCEMAFRAHRTQWRRGDSNPRPEMLQDKLLHA